MKKHRYKLIAAAALAILGTVSVFAVMRPTEQLLQTYEVRTGRFEVILETEGELESVSKYPIVSPFGGEIMRLLHIGERVDAGDIVLQMDAEKLNDGIVSCEAQLREIEAGRIKIQESISKQLNSAKLTIRRSEVALRLARLHRTEVESGPSAEDRLDAQRNLKSAAIIAANRDEELEILEVLSAKGLVTGQEVAAKRLDLVQAQSSFDKAGARHTAVIAGSSDSARKDASLKERIAEIELERSRKYLASLVEVTRAQLAKAMISEDRKRRELEENRDNLNKADVAAPVAGIVKLEKRRHWRTWSPGDWAWGGARILTIPAISEMKFTGKIDEDDIPLIREGQEVRVRLPYHPGRAFRGTLIKSAPLGRDAHAHLSDFTKEKIGEAERKVFDVEIKIDNGGTLLIPGLRAQGGVIVYAKDDAIVVPISALLSEAEEQRVLVLSGGRGSERPVTVGRRNDLYIEITSGLASGETVILRAE